MHDGKFTGSGQSSVVIALCRVGTWRGVASGLAAAGRKGKATTRRYARSASPLPDLGLAFGDPAALFRRVARSPSANAGPALTSLDIARSEPLKAPWPDVITLQSGRRTASVSQWIKKQTGGRALSIHLGRVRDAIERFDLILTTPQYALPVLRQCPGNRPAYDSCRRGGAGGCGVGLAATARSPAAPLDRAVRRRPGTNEV